MKEQFEIPRLYLNKRPAVLRSLGAHINLYTYLKQLISKTEESLHARVYIKQNNNVRNP